MDELDLELRLADLFASDARVGRWTDGFILHDECTEDGVTTIRGSLWTIDAQRAHPVMVRLSGESILFAAFSDVDCPEGRVRSRWVTPRDWLHTWVASEGS